MLGGGTVSPAAALVTLPALLALAWPLTGRERGWLAILGVQLVGQQVAHLLFGFAGTAAHPGHAALPADAWFYGHVTAAVAVATWLRWGERHTWAAARRAAAALVTHPPLSGPPPVARPDRVPAAVDTVPQRPRHPLRHTVVRRGPPLPA